MSRWSRRKVAGVAGLFLLGFALVGLVRSPVGAALVKSKGGFHPHELNDRVFFEPGAEAMAAPVATFLEEAERIIERAHGRPFRKTFRVYVCASQKSMNEFIAMPPGAPVRGAVRLGQVFLAPSAFQWRGKDVHRGSLLHELSHLHLRQQLGPVAARGRVPSWFHEGLADMVGEVGGERISQDAAVRAILHGPGLRPDSTGNLWTLKRVDDSGLGAPMHHKQSRMFLSFLRERDPSAFHALLLRLQEEKTFAGPYREEMGEGVAESWENFKASLTLSATRTSASTT